MAQEERVIIRVEVDADLAPLNRVHAALRALNAEERRLNRATSDMGKSIDRTTRASEKLDRVLGAVRSGFSKLFSIATKFNFYGMAGDITLVSVALGAVKLALVTGRFAASAYSAALNGLGIAAAGVAGAIGTVAAALNEFNQVSLAPFVGGFREAASAVRGTLGDSLLSYFGVEGLTGAVNALAKSGTVAANTIPTILRGVGNFAQDSKQLTALAQAYAQVSAQGKVTQDTLSALTNVNPVFASAIAEISTGKVLTGAAAQTAAQEAVAGGKITADEFAKAFTGELQSTDLWEGQLDRMNQTLYGMVKGFITRMAAIFTDFGTPFLEPFKEAVMEVEQITTIALIRMRKAVASLGVENVIPGIIELFQKFANFVVRAANSANLAKTIDTIGRWMSSIENFFRNIGAVLGPLEEGADKMLTLFGPFLRNIFGANGIGGLIMASAESFAENADAMERMGKALGDFAFAFMGIFRDIQDSFFSGSDTIADFFDTITHNVMPAIREMLALFRQIVGETLPVFSSILKEVSSILMPIIEGLRSLLGGPAGGVIAGALVGGKYGGLGGAAFGAGAGAGGGVGGLLGLAAYLGLSRGFKKGNIGVKGKHVAAGGGALSAFGGFGQLAAPALAGGLTGNYIGGALARNTEMGTGGITSLGAVGGGAVGAGAGAIYGLTIGSVGGPVGAAIGAAIGLIVGGITAWISSNGVRQMQDKFDDFADESLEALLGSFERSMAKGTGATGIAEARKQLEELTQSDNIASLAEQYELSYEQVEKLLTEHTQRAEDIIDAREKNLNMSLERIGDVTNMTRDQIEELADLMAVDLSDSLSTFTQDLYDLGLALDPAEARDKVLELGEIFTLDALTGPNSYLGQQANLGAAADMEEELNGMLDVLAAASESGDAAAVRENLGNMLETYLAITQLKYGAEGVELLQAADDFLGRITDPTSSAYVGDLAAQEAGKIQTQDVRTEQAAILAGTHEIWEPAKTAIQQMAAATGDLETFNWDTIFEERVRPQLEATGLGNASDIAVTFTESMTGAQAAIVTAGYDFSGIIQDGGMALYGDIVTAAATFRMSVEGAAAATRAEINRIGRVDYGPPSTGGDGPNRPNRTGGRGGGDTATSRFQRAMGFHSSMSSRLRGGGFSITSGIRNFGLGSLGSDHTTGAAYDVVGNSLGQYAQNVNAMGGFAEFHGTSASRHLHVVPPIGDSASPAIIAGGGGGGGNEINNVFHITGDNPEAIASAVMDKIEQSMRDQAERS